MIFSLHPQALINVWRVLQILSFVMVNKLVADPYMDEKFHVPQAAAYCRGDFYPYDPKLTTPPGLYLISYMLSKFGVPCSIVYFRALNLFIGIALLPDLCSKLYGSLHATANRLELDWAQCLAVMPILSFFSLLYYTDLASTYAVLLVYYLLSVDRRFLAATAAFISLWFRQTNLVWIVAFVAQYLIAKLQHTSPIALKDGLTSEATFSALAIVTYRLAVAAIDRITAVLVILAPFLPTAAISIVYLLYNGSIVLGDKSMHQAGFYPIQLCYLSIFVASMSAMLLAGQLYTGQLRRLVPQPKVLLVLLVFSCAAARQKSVQHPFLIADNRHFPFYLNKRIIQRLPDTLLGLFFAVASWIFYAGMLDASSLTTLILLGASALTLCPTSLLEFRYYIVPFMLWRLHAGHRKVPQGFLFLEAAAWMILNMGCVYVFLYHGFHWQDSIEIQRFMW